VSSKQVNGYVSRRFFILSVTADRASGYLTSGAHKTVLKYCLRALHGSNITK